MGFGTHLWTNIYFSHRSYKDIREVEDEIATLERRLEWEKQELRKWVFITDPDKFLRPGKDESVDSLLEEQLQYNFKNIESCIEALIRLRLLRDTWWETHISAGLAKTVPENIDTGTSYVWGDFVPSEDRPDADKSL